jgi:glycosyltransferase involved in cell wall biosynthesis
MRIVLLSLDPSVPLGGPEGSSVHLRAVADALLRTGHAVQLVTAAAGRPIPPSLLGAGLGVSVVPERIVEDDLARRLASVKPDLVIERLVMNAPQGARAASRLRVTHLYDIEAGVDEQAVNGHAAANLARAHAALRAGFEASNAAVAGSDEVAAWVRALAPADYRVEVMLNGAHRRFFAEPESHWTQHVRRTLGEPDGFRVGFVGTFAPWHDLETLVRAIGLLNRSVESRLVLVGDGPTRNRLLAEAHACGARIMLVGAVPDEAVPAYLAVCDAVAVPYTGPAACVTARELIEAMAAGRAVVASDTRACGRLVRDDVNGLLVACGDHTAMAVALERLARDAGLRDRLGAAARRRAREGGAWEDVVASVVELARGVAALGGAA